MEWKALSTNVKSRTDVTEVCRLVGYGTVDELLVAAGDGAADDLVCELVELGPVGVEVALAVLAPDLEWASSRLTAWTGEDVGELIVAACWERLRKGGLPSRPTRSVVGQARKHVVRGLQRSWTRVVATLPLAEHGPRDAGRPVGVVLSSADCVEDEVIDRMAEVDLIRWVMSVAEIDDRTARIIVQSRALGVSMGAVAATEGMAYHAAYRRRERAEKKLRSCVQSGGSDLTIAGV